MRGLDVNQSRRLTLRISLPNSVIFQENHGHRVMVNANHDLHEVRISPYFQLVVFKLPRIRLRRRFKIRRVWGRPGGSLAPEVFDLPRSCLAAYANTQ